MSPNAARPRKWGEIENDGTSGRRCLAGKKGGELKKSERNIPNPVVTKRRYWGILARREEKLDAVQGGANSNAQ